MDPTKRKEIKDQTALLSCYVTSTIHHILGNLEYFYVKIQILHFYFLPSYVCNDDFETGKCRIPNQYRKNEMITRIYKIFSLCLGHFLCMCICKSYVCACLMYKHNCVRAHVHMTTSIYTICSDICPCTQILSANLKEEHKQEDSIYKKYLTIPDPIKY